MAGFECPHCGRRLAISKENGPAGPWQPMRQLPDSSRRYGDITQPVPEFTEAYRDTPARAPSVEADWSVPARRAFTTGILFGTPLAIAAGIVTPRVNFGHDLLWGSVIVGATVAASWVLFLSTSDSTLWIRERIINKDLDGDRHIGKPPPLRIEVHEEADQHEHYVFANLPMPPRGYAGLVVFARDVLAGSSFSERTAAGHGYSRETWQALRDEFVDHEWAVWKGDDERQGVALNPTGIRVLRYLSENGIPREEE